MFTEKEVFRRTRALAVEHSGLDSYEITDESKFVDDLGMDSLDCIELTMALEEEFDIDIPDEQADACQTVGQAAVLALNLLRSQSRVANGA